MKEAQKTNKKLFDTKKLSREKKIKALIMSTAKQTLSSMRYNIYAN